MAQEKLSFTSATIQEIMLGGFNTMTGGSDIYLTGAASLTAKLWGLPGVFSLFSRNKVCVKIILPTHLQCRIIAKVVEDVVIILLLYVSPPFKQELGGTF